MLHDLTEDDIDSLLCDLDDAHDASSRGARLDAAWHLRRHAVACDEAADRLDPRPCVQHGERDGAACIMCIAAGEAA